MTEFLQQHAGFHFILAFVEIALFQAPGGYIAQPRILARTTNIDRGIVTLEENRIVIKPPSAIPAPGGNGGRRTTITQERYFEELEKELPGISPRLNNFLDALTAHNVYPEFGTDSMILRWRSGDGKNWNLGTLSSKGQVFMDGMSSQASNAGLLEIQKEYLQKLAHLVPNALVKKSKTGNAWNVISNGRSLTLDALLAPATAVHDWVRAMADFQTAVTQKSDD